jgi:hypothetical protein
MKYLVLCLTLSACGSDHLLESGKYDLTITYEKDWVYPPGYVSHSLVSIDDSYHMHNEVNHSLDAPGQDLDGVAVFTEHQELGDAFDGWTATFKAWLTPTSDGFEGKVWEVIEAPESYALTGSEAMKAPEQIPEVVKASIRKSFPAQAKLILKDLQFDTIMGCYYFTLCSMYVGVELDGYCHT